MGEVTWFSTWFDSPYYHVLYSSRDDHEAKGFIEALQSYLNIKPGAFVLDAACGKGRHAKMLQRLGMDVEGFDLSPSNIEQANKLANKHLHFFVHDIRSSLPKQDQYDVVFNFFTSFGYFDTQAENQLVANAFAAQLKEGAYLIFDFLNVHKTIKNLVEQESKTIDNITFHITRKIDQGFIIKTIEVEDPQQGKLVFHEKVAALDKERIAQFFIQAGLHQMSVFGNYRLDAFKEEESDRLIYIFKKL